MSGFIDRLVRRLSGPPRTGSKWAAGRGNEPDYEELARLLSSKAGFRVLRAIDPDDGVEGLHATAPGERVAAVVDTETTGLDPAADRIIEIAVQRFTFDDSHRITQTERSRSWLEDPGRPLPADIVRLTGLSDADLSGRRFDDEAIIAAVGAVDVVIAHNAAFDRPFLDRRFPQLEDLAWACSMSQLDWRGLGYDGRALGHLLLQSGRFFDGHRAGNDTTALTTLLGTTTKDGRTVLYHLLESCQRNGVRIDAVGAPFETKDALKGRGYRWNATRRVWRREIEVASVEAERDWLDQQVYRGRGGPELTMITPRTRFKPDASSSRP